jgi:hypothetical protein
MTSIITARGHALLLVLMIGVLSACAELIVAPVTKDNEATVKGVRYYLPKPFIIFAPQADGTVTATIVYMPDTSHEYAIDTSSTMSSYGFQASTDPVGLLTAVQYNADSTAVASQASASVGAGVAQVMNYEAARSVAVQTQVNAAQNNVITAQSAYSAALAALNSDTQANITTPGTVMPAALAIDASTIAQKQAALQVAQSALQAAQSTPQAVAGTAAAGTPITTTPAAPSTAFGPQTWGTGLSLSLPEQFGPVWFSVNDSETGGVSLSAVRSKLHGVTPDPPPNELDPQPAFDTTFSALGPPQIAIPTTPFTLASQLPAAFMFNRDVTAVKPTLHRLDMSVVTDPVPVWDQKRTITLDLTKLKPGGYWLEAQFRYPRDPKDFKDPNDPKDTKEHGRPGTQRFLFSVTAK